MNFKAYLAATALALSATSASALIVGVTETGGQSTAGVSASILSTTPDEARDDNVTNDAMQGFNEQQGFELKSDIKVDKTGDLGDPSTNFKTIAAGTVVNSHMIFLNSQGNQTITHSGVEWEFDGKILGVMSDEYGVFEAASAALGADKTTYPNYGNNTFTARGLDDTARRGGNGYADLNGDGYSFQDNFLTISMAVSEPGDWVRVVTAPVPLPAASIMLISVFGGLGGAAALRRRREAA